MEQIKGRGYKSRDCQYTPRLAEAFNEEVQLDLLGPLQEDHGFRYIMGVEDFYSRFLILMPQKTKTAQTISYIGPMHRIHSDEGGEFKNSLFRKLCLALEVEHSFAPLGSHSSMVVEQAFLTSSTTSQRR